MVWIVGSVIILGVFAGVIFTAVSRGPADQPFLTPGPLPTDDTLAQRVRRLEDDLDDVSGQMSQLRDDVQYLMRQLEDRG